LHIILPLLGRLMSLEMDVIARSGFMPTVVGADGESHPKNSTMQSGSTLFSTHEILGRSLTCSGIGYCLRLWVASLEPAGSM